MNIRKTVLFTLFKLVILTSAAQDVQLSQFHIADLLLNPGMTGGQHRNRFIYHQRIQWPSLQGKYVTSFFSYDTFLGKYKSGIGAYLWTDNQGGGIMKTYSWRLLYSYELHLTKKWTFRFGLEGGAYHKKVDDEELVYPNQVTANGIDYGTINPESVRGLNYSQPDFGVGGIIYSDKFWGGFSIYHFNGPRQKFIIGDEIYPIKYDFQMGYMFKLGHLNAFKYTGYKKPFYLFPVVHYKFQGKSDQFEIGADMIDDQLRVGLWYRGIPFKKFDKGLHNNEAFIFLVGWTYKHLKMSYSYDAVISKLSQARTGGAHEIHLSYIFPLVTKHHNFKRLPCPDFQRSTKKNVDYSF